MSTKICLKIVKFIDLKLIIKEKTRRNMLSKNTFYLTLIKYEKYSDIYDYKY